MDELLNRALELPELERLRLARRLLLSVSELPLEGEANWEASWVREVEARIASYEGGAATAQDWRHAVAEIHAVLKRKP